MTLGDLISNYLSEGNTMTDFSKESGISRAYAYMLMKNKNSDGGQIAPSIETIKKVAHGIHIPFDAVIAMLDDDSLVTIEGNLKKQRKEEKDKELLAAFHAAPQSIQKAILMLLDIEKV